MNRILKLTSIMLLLLTIQSCSNNHFELVDKYTSGLQSIYVYKIDDNVSARKVEKFANKIPYYENGYTVAAFYTSTLPFPLSSCKDFDEALYIGMTISCKYGFWRFGTGKTTFKKDPML